MKKTIFLSFISLFFIFFLCLIPNAIATTEYNQSGNYDTQYHLGLGYWNSELEDFDSYSAGLADDLRNPPLLSDLDRDGISELIILDGDTIKLYQNITLDLLDGVSLDADERYSNMIAFDIDADNLTEIIIIEEESEKLHLYEYNGTSFHEQVEVSLAGLTAYESEFMIQCRDTNDCLMAYSNRINGVANPGTSWAAAFNSTAVGAETGIGTTAPSDGIMCTPQIRHIALGDYDKDGTIEYVLTFGEVVGNVLTSVHIHWIHVAAMVTAEEHETEQTSPNINIGATNCETGIAGRYFSSPLVHNIDGLIGNGLETVVAVAYDADEYKMYSFESDASAHDDYPEVQQSDGLIISNVFIANTFSDTGRSDFCVAGYDTTDDILDVTCASEQTGDLIETREYFYDTDYDLTISYRNLNILSHSTEQSTVTTEGVNLDEIINSYGVFTFDEDSCDITANCDLTNIFENPEEDATTLNLDLEDTGRDDILTVTDTNIFLLDDQFENQGGEITSYTINPCLDATWQINTTVQVQIEVTDDEDDDVSARSFLYYDEANEQDSDWSVNASSGTTFSFSFIANSTTPSSILKLVGRDVENPTENDTIDLSFSVGDNGVVYGDCSTTVDITDEDEEEAEVTETDLNNNSITNFVNAFTENTGLGGSLLWLIIMVITAAFIWTSTGSHAEGAGSYAFGVIAIVEVLLIIIGAILGFLSTGVLIAVVICFVAVLAISFRRIFLGGT